MLQAEIINEVYKAMQHLGAKSDLLQIIGSWHDTLDDDEILRMLREWNGWAEAGKIDYLPSRSAGSKPPA